MALLESCRRRGIIPPRRNLKPFQLGRGGTLEAHALLRDFRTDSRMLLLVGLAVPVGLVRALVAKALRWLIASFPISFSINA